MAAKVSYKSSVAGDLRRLDRAMAQRVVRKIEKVLAEQGGYGDPLAGDFAGLFKLRVGDHRVIFARTEDGYLVLRIAHRSEAYRRGRP